MATITAQPTHVDVAAPSGEADIIRAAIADLTAVATLPQVTSKIISLVENPRSSAQQLEKLVQNDPALVSRLLKVVNSSFYGLPGEIASIDRAIVLLGLQAVKNIAVAASLGQMFRGKDLGAGKSASDLWRHCIAVAVGSRKLAEATGMCKPDEAFLCGMVHDIGLLVAAQTWPEKFRKVIEEVDATGESFLEVERRMTGTDHANLGAALCAKWKFPAACRDVCRFHHKPELNEDHRGLSAVVFAADTLACEVGGGFDLTGRRQHLKPQDAKAVYLSAESTDALRAELPDLIEEASQIL
ncbi:MAG: HDOD domain-containing protein [Planctomycetota bacterium]